MRSGVAGKHAVGVHEADQPQRDARVLVHQVGDGAGGDGEVAVVVGVPLK